MAIAFWGASLVLFAALCIIRRVQHSSNVPLPPGPKGFPLLGAALSIDASKPWFTYFQWRKLYGEFHVYSHLASLIHYRRSHLLTHFQYEHTRYKLCKSRS